VDTKCNNLKKGVNNIDTGLQVGIQEADCDLCLQHTITYKRV
jgi:hypothetical protein